MKKTLTNSFYSLILFGYLLCSQATYLFGQTKGKGQIGGRILDKTSNEPLIGATVQVKGTSTGAAADFEGKFIFSIEPGQWQVEVKMIGYKGQLYSDVKVQNGEPTMLTIFLTPETIETKEVEIISNLKKNNENALLEDQRASNSIGNGISAELLAKTPDRSLSESFRRISATSIREGKFAMVRGLNERYNQGQLNGVAITSTEADRKAFALDIFPTNLVDKIVVTKSVTPDQPGDFAGGVIKIQTLDIPFSNSFSISLAGETHSLTTFKDFDYLKPSKTDIYGFDNGQRAIPNYILLKDEYDINPNEQLKTQQSLAFNHNYVPLRRNAGPNLSGQISLARRGNILGKTAGLVASFSYFRTYQRNEFISYFPSVDSSGRKALDFDSTHQDRYKISTNLSGLVNLSVKPSATSKVSLRNFFSQNSTEQTQTGNSKSIQAGGTNISEARTFNNFYEQVSLLSSQLGVEKFFGTDGMKLEYIGGINILQRSTPDFKRLNYSRSGNVADTNYQNQKYEIALTSGDVFNPAGSGKFFSSLNEIATSSALNFTIPFKVFKIKNEAKAGVYYLERFRTFQGRNFLYGFGSVGSVDIESSKLVFLSPDKIFSPENFAPSLFQLRETTSKSDFYKANVALQAGYLMNETFLHSNGSKVVYGLRYESYYQAVTSARINERKDRRSVSTVNDFFPSVNLNLNLNSKLTLRTGLSQTVNRPELRELSPFQFYDPNLNAVVFGSDSLRRARITNADVKLEFYPGSGRLFSVNWFYKKFDQPIEFLRDPVKSPPFFTYINADQATNYGVEFEFRTNMAFVDSLLSLSGPFSNLSVFSNFSVIRSTVNLIKGEKIERPLQGQSPYIFNAGIQYGLEKLNTDIALTFNRIGPRVAFVAPTFGGLIWEKPRNILDISINTSIKKLSLKLIFGDLLQQELIQYIVQDPNNTRKSDKTTLGRLISDLPDYKAGTDIPFFRYTFGRTIRFSVGYKF